MRYASATIIILTAWLVGTLLALLSNTTETRMKLFLLLSAFSLTIFLMVFNRKR